MLYSCIRMTTVGVKGLGMSPEWPMASWLREATLDVGVRGEKDGRSRVNYKLGKLFRRALTAHHRHYHLRPTPAARSE